MIKEALRQIIQDNKEKTRFLRYKNNLPNKPNNNDLYIVEFPKSGITWLSTIIANTCFLEEGINKESTHYNIEQLIGDVHQNKTISDINYHFPYHRIIKSHDNYNPYYRHVIYLVRNPFSVMISYYHFTLSNKYFDGTFHDFIRSEKFGVKSWVRHVESWLTPQKALKLHCLKYENLIDDPLETIKNLYINLGWKIEENKIMQSIKLSSFDNMKLLNNHYKEFCPFRKYDFVRKGKKTTDMSTEDKEYIYNCSVEILKDFYFDMV